jgi:hypothetical protein
VVCPACLGDDLEWVDLPTQGTVAGYVVQGSGLPPGFGDWAIFALVDVGPVRLLSRLVGCQPSRVHVGMPVALAPWEVPGAPGQPHRLLPAFTPASRTWPGEGLTMQPTHGVLAPLIQGAPPPRPLFVPLYATLAAAVAGLDVPAFLRDHGTWPPRVASGTLQPPPADLEAAARASPTLETVRRLKGLLPPAAVLAVVLTGPCRFAGLTGGSPQEWGQALVTLAQLALGAGARLLLFEEGPAPPADPEGWHELMAPVVGTVRFWQGAAALLLTGSGAGWEPVLRHCGPEMVVVLEEATAGRPHPDIPLPPLWGLALRPGEDSPVAPGPAVPALVTTAGDLYGQVPVAELPAAVRRLRARCHPSAC